MRDPWAQLMRYKLAEEKLNELKRRVWMDLPWDEDIQISLKEAEEDLSDLRGLIEMNIGVKKVD